MKTKKFLAFIVAAILVLTAFSGCNSNKNNADNNDATEEKTIDANSAEAVSETFVTSLMNSDFETALSCLGLEESKSFLTESDIEFYFPRSSFADVSNIDYEEYSITTEKRSSDSDRATCKVTVKDNTSTEKNPISKTITVYTALNDNNQWVVVADEFYYTNYTFRTAGGNTEISVNGKEVSQELCTNNSADSETGLEREYTLPFVGKREIEVTLTSDNYTYTTTLATSSDNEVGEQDRVFKQLDKTEAEDCLASIKDTWNNLYKDYTAGKKSSEEIDYLSSDADTSILNRIWDGFESMCASHSIESARNDNYNFTQCKQSSGKEIYWITDDKILVNFDYELSWVYVLANWNQSMKRQSEIVLSKENNKYKIAMLPDGGLFNECNDYVQEW